MLLWENNPPQGGKSNTVTSLLWPFVPLVRDKVSLTCYLLFFNVLLLLSCHLMAVPLLLNPFIVSFRLCGVFAF